MNITTVSMPLDPTDWAGDDADLLLRASWAASVLLEVEPLAVKLIRQRLGYQEGKFFVPASALDYDEIAERGLPTHISYTFEPADVLGRAA